MEKEMRRAGLSLANPSNYLRSYVYQFSALLNAESLV